MLVSYKNNLVEKGLIKLNYVILVLLGIITLYPFIYFLVLSLNDGFDSMKGGIYLWPREFTLDNYIKAFQNPYILNSFYITIFRTVIGTCVSVIFTAMLAYALIHKDLPGRTALIFYFFFTTIFSGGLIPFYILMRQMHLTNNIWIFVLPFVYNFFNVIIMRTYFESLPSALRESAIIDGCGEAAIFIKIFIPLSMSMLATIALFYGVAYWNDWFTGAYFVTDKKLMPAATLLQQILTEASFSSDMFTPGRGVNIGLEQSKAKTTPEALQMTFLVITTLPIICVYPFLQKYFVKGVMIGSVKG